MQANSDVLSRASYLVGSAGTTFEQTKTPALTPFSEPIVEFLNDLSRIILRDPRSKAYSDVVSFGFWVRKSSLMKLKERFDDGRYCLGRGVAFHIAPSNVPVNFAYSLASALMCGNANIVRIPSKGFPQVDILTDAINAALSKHPNMKNYIVCVRYDRDKEINDLFSSIADVRIVWGGDQTISEIRKSPLPPRSGEITFADRYSLAVIDSDAYLKIDDKPRVAVDFYNDTFFSDQNACTSPRIIVWTGGNIAQAKEAFWREELELVRRKYNFQAIQGVNKLTKSYIVSATDKGAKIEPHEDNLIVRISLPHISGNIADYFDNSGFFYEIECEDIKKIRTLCNDKRCQTIAYIGEKDILTPLIDMGIKGIDRIVPMGRTMDFDLIWDGYNLPAIMTRTISIV